MKTLILTFISLLMLQSCSKSDDANTQLNNEIVGTWKLIKFEAGFGPTFNYDGEIIKYLDIIRPLFGFC